MYEVRSGGEIGAFERLQMQRPVASIQPDGRAEEDEESRQSEGRASDNDTAGRHDRMSRIRDQTGIRYRPHVAQQHTAMMHSLHHSSCYWG